MEKSILVIATLLVAAVAGQYLDLDTPGRFIQRKQDFSSRSLRRLLGHPLERSLIYGESLQVPSYLRDDIFDVSVLPIEGVVTHPLFSVYMGLPYFQQYWSYPMFQRYVGSQYFQRFWEVPGFQRYFVSPVLFYKYIYPLVNIFKYDTINVPTPYYGYYPYTAKYNRIGYYPNYYHPIGQRQVSLDNLQELYYKGLLDRMISQVSVQQDRQQNDQLTPVDASVGGQTVGNTLDLNTTEDEQLTFGDETRDDENLSADNDFTSASSVPSEESDEDDSVLSEQKMSGYNKNKYNNPSQFVNPILHLLNGY